MGLAQSDPIDEYRRDVRGYVWLGVIFGVLLILVGLVLEDSLGDWFTIVGAMLTVLVALRYWTMDLVPDRLIAERLNERNRASTERPPPPRP